MSSVIQQETIIFLSAILHGILLTFLYDILRALRRAFVHSLKAVSAEDFLFWLAVGFATFCLLFERTDGVLRGYVAAGILLGTLLYHYTISQILVKLLTTLFDYAGKGLCFLHRCLVWPVCRAAAAGKKIIEFVSRRGYNLVIKKRKRRKTVRRGKDYCAHKDKRGRRYGKKKKTSKQK